MILGTNYAFILVYKKEMFVYIQVNVFYLASKGTYMHLMFNFKPFKFIKYITTFASILPATVSLIA